MKDKSKLKQVHIGDTIGKWTIIECIKPIDVDVNFKGLWLCEGVNYKGEIVQKELNGQTLLNAQLTHPQVLKTKEGTTRNAVGRPSKIQEQYGNDLTGIVFGNWQVIGPGEPYQNKTNQYTRKTWVCKCLQCGEEYTILESNLFKQDSTMCRNCSNLIKAEKILQNSAQKYKISPNDKFGNYIVLQEVVHKANNDKSNVFLCECLCNLKTHKLLQGSTLWQNKNNENFSCDLPGCITNNDAIVNEEGEMTFHVCYKCGKLQPIDMFRDRKYQKFNECLECTPYTETELKRMRTDLERTLDESYDRYKKSAENRGYIFELTKEQFNEIVLQPCFYCGHMSTKSLRGCGDLAGEEKEYVGIDRVDNDKGYIEGNVVPCCNLCNIMKNKRDVFLWMNKICEIADKREEIYKKLDYKGIRVKSKGKE